MSDEFPFVTTENVVETFESVRPIFRALLNEIRELSKKKPDAIMSKSKVSLINGVLNDVLSITKDEAQGKYLALLDEVQLPQVSDALLMMVQFDVAMKSFQDKYMGKVGDFRDRMWITEEMLQDLNEDDEISD